MNPQNTPREHILVLVDPSDEGEAGLDLAHDSVVRGGAATVLMVVTPKARSEFREFAMAENLHESQAEGIALRRLHDRYVSWVGSPQTRVHVSSGDVNRQALALADETHATMIAIPQSYLRDRRWRAIASSSRVPVVAVPQRAAAA